MISPQNPVSATEVSGRGFVVENVESKLTTPMAAGVYDVNATLLDQWRLPYFWRTVIAGTLLVYSIVALSAVLMLACHVGTIGGVIAFGGGAAVWMVITACIAYFFGGWAASCFSGRKDGNFLRGLGVWALSIPLFTLIRAFVRGPSMGIGGNSIASEYVSNNTEFLQFHAGNLVVNYGAAWTVFLALILGLLFAFLGSTMTPVAASPSTTPSSR